ncbi:MAG: glucokinase, partial [Anaerolineales bacterium]|nr:glucokinase [Anaerolineales bacterium]
MAHWISRLSCRLKSDDRPVSAEDIISGPGLALLYKAVCMIHGQSFAEND